ncbi:hypothetical protein, partial [Aquirufa nivalisilvae]|uniref:hypothetical protein n=1 Tax=Aquirufa nivalisilvae TaxID=2516557 RepID=UPI0022A9EAFB
MKKLTNNQISLMSVVDDLIYTNLFKKILSQGRVPYVNNDINFGKWEFYDKVEELNIKSPEQINPTLDEKETLLMFSDIFCLELFKSNNLVIHTTKEELLNFLL